MELLYNSDVEIVVATLACFQNLYDEAELRLVAVVVVAASDVSAAAVVVTMVNTE